jgi:hypothetical protein
VATIFTVVNMYSIILPPSHLGKEEDPVHDKHDSRFDAKDANKSYTTISLRSYR